MKVLVVDGRSIQNQNQLLEYVESYFAELYRKDIQVEENQTARDICFRSITKCVTEEDNLELIKPLSKEELK